MKKRQLIITAALPYANGSMHLGHMLEYIQTDIWHRFQKLQGNESYFIWGSDAHGSAIMLRAEKEGITPEALIDKARQENQKDFLDFQLAFDSFYTTHSPENEARVGDIYQKLYEANSINVRDIEQAYDPIKNMFLPDRFIKGDCPRCNAGNQYGDNCEVCGATYSPAELKNARSVVSGATPIQKASQHYFFKLGDYKDFLEKWLSTISLSPAISNKLKEWFEAGLQDWDISRDSPYFGFKIPGTDDKYFYVWVDAPVGYIASFEHFAKSHPALRFEDFWGKNSTVELHHFIGKDIMYFHTLFWPAMLKGAGYRLPTGIHTHGFLTVNGQKMSKSRGTFVKARTYLKVLSPAYLRYYFATKLGDSIEDIDLNFEDFAQRVNSDLIGKYINIASRTSVFIHKYFSGKLSNSLDNLPLIEGLIAASAPIAGLYEARQFSHAMREIMALADEVNQYIAAQAPWSLVKQEATLEKAHQVCSTALNAFRLLTLYLSPVLPELSKEVECFLAIPALHWDTLKNILTNHAIQEFKPLLSRISPEDIVRLKEAIAQDA
jgi:methionyl-tRNA synthetase